MAYVTYEYYTTYHTGTTSPIASAEFSYYEKKARQFVDFRTLNKSQTYTEEATELRDAMCELMDKLKAFDTDDKYDRGAISSEHVGEYSVTYNVGMADSDDIKNRELDDVLKLYLGLTGLLYRGQ